MSQPMVGDRTGWALRCLLTQTIPGFFDLMKSPPQTGVCSCTQAWAVLEQEKQLERGHFVPLDIQWQLPRDAQGVTPPQGEPTLTCLAAPGADRAHGKAGAAGEEGQRAGEAPHLPGL